jgi:putative oxidoreductase
MKVVVLAGRIIFSLIFLMAAIGHFSSAEIAYASSAGVPMASILVPLSGVISALGALSIILGYKARFGALLLVIFLLPVTLYMHAFWMVTDPMMKQMQMAMFMKNMSALGGALIICYFGSGPLSIDSRKETGK